MKGAAQAGFSLIEAIVAVAIVAVAAGAWLSAMTAFGRFSTHQTSPVRSAAWHLAEQTLRQAQNAWKYGSPGNAPSGTWSTAVPLSRPDGSLSSAPVSVTASVSGGEASITVRYTPDPQHSGDGGSVTLRGTLAQEAPLPGSRIVRPALIPQPSGAP